ncbi:malonic semialdehyde reductase [Sphingomonas naphthae]|uniref:Putative NADH dehydrogenase/NAD(P)H nitroreductase PQ455_11565 n=1 Tax=Sphingomonas naphthae TaxID=1813468 RepID=A0ABY7TH22_9SPHN|nr:malonic semialdehyde reductase [Sphingomonas naphthae]WCT72276.1 malonic semialdehyde reductase [Sphingomonas naphthae]
MAEPLPDAALDRLFRTSRSYNGYLDTPVAESDLRAIYDLMKFGPTAANQQPVRIVWCVSQEAKDRLAACASATNAAKISKAPVAVVLGMDLEFYEKLHKTFPHTDAKAWFMKKDGTPNEAAVEESAFRNSSLQGAYFLLAARAVGLDVGPMSGFDAAKVDAAFFAGQPVKVNFIATLGHGDPASIFDRLPRLDFEEATRIA